jgi:uncharacterized protein (TIGR03435 family)
MLPRPQKPMVAMPVYSAVDEVGMPFSVDSVPAVDPTHAAMRPRHEWGTRLMSSLPAVLAGVWFCGVVGVLVVWCGGWLRVKRTLRRARQSEHGREAEILRRVQAALGGHGRVRLLLSRELMEPGMFGILRPVLIWPQRLSERLDDEHIAAIVAHELMHARRRDNLTAALHMATEAALWFHPLVWWMERKMVEERERACDEAVVAMGSRPGVYAESLLKACRFCVESPLVCVAGITGADLAARVRAIMTLRSDALGLWRKAALGALAVAAIVLPMAFGVVRMIPVYGQVLKAAGPLPSYDVVVIKPSKDPAQGASTEGEQTHYLMTAKMLIQFAYGIFSPPKVMDLNVVGGPDWINSDVFSIVGKMESTEFEQEQKLGRAQRHERRQLMEQSLLAERFKLKMHVETRDEPVYALTVMKGLKLTPAKDATGGAHVNPYPSSANPDELKRGLIVNAKGRNFVMTVKGMTLDTFVDALIAQKETSRRHVVNQTGLTGAYDFTLTWGPDDTVPTESEEAPEPPLFMAIQQQLGLKLAEGKGPAEVVVIDHIEKPVFDEASAPAPVVRMMNVAYTPAGQSVEPHYEAAIVKPNLSGCCTSSRATADQMMLSNETLKNLVILAYGVQPEQVTGPDWMEKVRYDITAKYPPGTKYGDRWLMLRKLLAERFNLTTHSEMREIQGYSLLVAKGGFKLKPSDPGEASTTGGSQGAVWTLNARKIPLSVLTWELSDSLGEVVVDQTGLNGTYDFQLRWATNQASSPGAAESDPAPSVFTAVEETLGLHLQHGKVKAPMIVVDHMERVPTEN